ncbi:MAG TPA: DUF4276 family protein [Elusimicrobiota bacterium]|nr:DUF4276 family protein [Elusimicrobiota bacterium]
MSKCVGIIAEDKSDADVVSAVIQKLRPRKKWRFHIVAGGGCGRIKSKCLMWAQELYNKGCSHLVLVRDSDGGDPEAFRSGLEQKLISTAFSSRIIVIPVRTIEAWLLADELAIQKLFELRKMPNSIAHPENELDPKGKLEEIVHHFSGGARIYVTTIHNAQLAKIARIKRLQRCKSYLPLESYIDVNF